MENMKEFILKKKDINDLIMILNDVVSTEKKNMDFKDLIILQKLINDLKNENREFLEVYTNIVKERDEIIKQTNEKINIFREEKLAEVEKDVSKSESLKKNLEDFSNLQIEHAKVEVNKHIEPQIEKLYTEAGEEKITFELSEDKSKILREMVEKFAKERYIDVSKMLEIYEILTK